MSDKNPYYSIPKSLGEHIEEVEMLPVSPDMSMIIELRERMERQIMEVMFGTLPAQRPTALALRSGRIVTLELDAAGKVIEPPAKCPKCGPVLLCSEHMGRIT
jgi:ribosomal protein S27AE